MSAFLVTRGFTTGRLKRGMFSRGLGDCMPGLDVRSMADRNAWRSGPGSGERAPRTAPGQVGSAAFPALTNGNGNGGALRDRSTHDASTPMRPCCGAPQHAHERVHHDLVELRAAAPSQFGYSVFNGDGRAVRPIRRHSIEGVCHS